MSFVGNQVHRRVWQAVVAHQLHRRVWNADPESSKTPGARGNRRSHTAQRALVCTYTCRTVAARRRGMLPSRQRPRPSASRRRSEAAPNTAHRFTCFVAASLRDQKRTWFRAIQPAVFTHWKAICAKRPPNPALQQTASRTRSLVFERWWRRARGS